MDSKVDPEVARLVAKFGLDKNGCSLNKAGFTRNRTDKRPSKRLGCGTVSVDSNKTISVDPNKNPNLTEDERYKKSIEDGIKDFQNEHARFINAIGKDNYAASKNRFRKGDSSQISFITEEPEPPKIEFDPKNINLLASLDRVRQQNEQRKREEAEANYNINRLECKNMDYITASKDRATKKVIRERRKAGWDARNDTKKELGNTRKETINDSKYENSKILQHMHEQNPNFSRLIVSTAIVNDTVRDISVEQAKVLSNRNINFIKKTVEEDLILDSKKQEEKITGDEIERRSDKKNE